MTRPYEILDWNGNIVAAVSLDEIMQASTLCGDRSLQAETMVSKRDDLREHATPPRVRRYVLTDPRELIRKLSLETGYDDRRDVFLAAPLEPWTSPHPVVGQRIYQRILIGRDGADQLTAYSGIELEEVAWMAGEELLAVRDNRLVPLSDLVARDRRAYPGARLPDSLAKAGKQLRGHADGLVLAAFSNLWHGRGHRKGRPAGERTAKGMRLTAAEICEEANRIRRWRPDLVEYRYLSVETCRRTIRRLIDEGSLGEAEKPRAVRERRSWRTIARTFEAPRVLERFQGRAAPT